MQTNRIKNDRVASKVSFYADFFTPYLFLLIFISTIINIITYKT
jgi:hypothetical protein